MLINSLIKENNRLMTVIAANNDQSNQIIQDEQMDFENSEPSNNNVLYTNSQSYQRPFRPNFSNSNSRNDSPYPKTNSLNSFRFQRVENPYKADPFIGFYTLAGVNFGRSLYFGSRGGIYYINNFGNINYVPVELKTTKVMWVA